MTTGSYGRGGLFLSSGPNATGPHETASNLRPGLRVAIIHYWLVGMRGGEKVLEQLCTMFPQADIYTHAYRPDKVSPQLRAHRVITTSVGRLPFASRLYQKYLPLMPAALLSRYHSPLGPSRHPSKMRIGRKT